MSFRNQTQFVAVASGSTIGSPFDLRGYAMAGLFIPSSLTTQIFLQGTYESVTNPSSALFARVQLRDGSGDWSVASAAANKALAVTLEEIAAPFPKVRVELGTAATNTRTFSMVGKL